MNRVLFPAALVGTLVVVGLALSTLGPVVLACYVALLVAALVALVRRARAERRPAGSTCSCCTSTVHDPVELR